MYGYQLRMNKLSHDSEFGGTAHERVMTKLEYFNFSEVVIVMQPDKFLCLIVS